VRILRLIGNLLIKEGNIRIGHVTNWLLNMAVIITGLFPAVLAIVGSRAHPSISGAREQSLVIP
jgi:hypothetical membrane protein